MLRPRLIAPTIALALVATLTPARATTTCTSHTPFAGLPGASLTSTVHTSKDVPPVRYVMHRGTVPSFDGLPMSVDVTIPCDASGPIPLVTMAHG